MGLIPIHLYLYKLSGRAQLRAHSLSHNHILQALLKSRPSLYNILHHFLLDLLSPCQQEIIKDSIVDIDNKFNEIFPAFDPHNKEFSSSSWIIDIFPSQFSFHFSNKCSEIFQISSEDSSSTTPIIQLNPGNTQVIVIGHFIKLLIRNLNSSITYLTSLVNLLGTSARKANVTTSYLFGR